MRTAFILHDCDNESLLRFTQTKLLFDAKNQSTDFINHIVTVPDYDSAEKLAGSNDVILETGDFLTTSFRHNYTKYAKDNEFVIKFDKQIPIDFKRRYYKPGSKQLYIIENLLKVCIRSNKLVYLDNNEPATKHTYDATHLYGLASGWKTVLYALQGNFETITVYDYCDRQLKFAEYLHSQPELPKTVTVAEPTSGVYNPSSYLQENWINWHNMKVNFKKIDLFDAPVFPDDSLIWISNSFLYEPTIFTRGYETTVQAKNKLQELNKNSIITTD
jgi:hypothetical protein